MRIKIFMGSYPDKLESAANTWIETNESENKILDVVFSVNQGQGFVMIKYQIIK